MASPTSLLRLIFMLALPVSVLPQYTQQCTLNKEVVVEKADVRFALMMSFRKNDESLNAVNSYICSSLSRGPVQNFLAAEWVVERLNNANNGTGFIPGVKIGFYSLDDCRSSVYSSRSALSFLDVWVPSTIQTCTYRDPQALHIGIIGPSRSSTASTVASLLRDVQVPIISMAATSSELSNKKDYPTFFRTVPSDDHQVDMTVQILEQLSWTYVAVVHTNDGYGKSAAAKLTERATAKGICVVKSLPYGGGSPDINNELLALIKNAKGNSIAIPFFGSRDKAEQLLGNLDKLAKVDGRDVTFGFHIILSESSNIDVSIYRNKRIGYGTMAVATSGIFLADLYDDLVAKVERVKKGEERHDLIQKYYQDNPNSPLIDKTLDTFIPLTVHAVFALAEALRVEHSDACNGQPKICENLLLHIEKGIMLERVRDVFVDYNTMASGVPPKIFQENNYTVRFDENGDIIFGNKNPAYTLHQYRGQDTYEQIGVYVDKQTVLDMDKIKFNTLSGQVSQSIPTSMCNSDCADCYNSVVRNAFIEGDVYILGIFSLHETSSDSPFECGRFRSVGNDAIVVEGFLYAIRKLRESTGIKFGAIGIDDCYSSLRSTSILSECLSTLSKSNTSVFSHGITKDKIAGVVACRTSGCTVPTAQFFMPLKIPVISYAASSPDLDDKVNFPYFLRTVPSDVFQAKVMLDVLKQMEWAYTGLLYVKNNYGAKAMKEFKNQAMMGNSGVCVAQEIGMNEAESESDSSDFRKICQQLLDQNVKVVVFFGIDGRFRSFLSFIEKNEAYLGKFIFFGSEDWAVNLDIYNSGQRAARGSLTLKVQDIQLESDKDFEQHLRSKRPAANDSNIWFTEFWQNVFNCNMKGGFINTFPRDCDETLKLSEEQLARRTGEQRVTQVINAVNALGNGLKAAKERLCEDEFPCGHFYQNIGTVVELIKEQTRKQGNMKYNVFDSNGNGAIGFDVYNIQPNSEGNPYVKVGTFASKNNVNLISTIFRKAGIKFYTETGVVLTEFSAKCSENYCNHCQSIKLPPIGENINTSPVPVSEYRQSDILLISLIIVLILAMLVATAALIVCFTKKYQGLTKTIQSCKEKIYEEPVYQTYPDSHGIRFANSMNPYPIINNVGLTNSDSNVSEVGGVNNPAFINDVDSISPNVAVRNQKNLPQSNKQSQSGIGPVSMSSSRLPVPLLSTRPLPLSPIGHNQAYAETDSNKSNICQATSVAGSDPKLQKNEPESQTPANGSVFLAFATPRKGSDAREAAGGIVYYMQGPNGQLMPQSYIPVNPDEMTEPPGAHSPQHESVQPLNSLTISYVNPSHGPYSTAAALQNMKLIQDHPYPIRFSNGNEQTSASPIAYSAMKNGSNSNSTRPVMLNGNHPFSNTEVEYSPIHYASPARNIQNPTFIMTTEPGFQTPLSYTTLQQTSSQIGSSNQFNSSTHDSHDMPENNVRQLGHPPDDLSPDASEQSEFSGHSMINLSIPDVIGHSSMVHAFPNEASLETINLSSSRESLDDCSPDEKSPAVVQYNGKAKLSALAALSGNVSRV